MGAIRMKNPKQKLLSGVASTALVFLGACTTLPEPENVETPEPKAETCQQETNEECPATNRIKNLRDGILKGEKIKHSEEANTNTASIIEPE